MNIYLISVLLTSFAISKPIPDEINNFLVEELADIKSGKSGDSVANFAKQPGLNSVPINTNFLNTESRSKTSDDTINGNILSLLEPTLTSGINNIIKSKSPLDSSPIKSSNTLPEKSSSKQEEYNSFTSDIVAQKLVNTDFIGEKEKNSIFFPRRPII